MVFSWPALLKVFEKSPARCVCRGHGGNLVARESIPVILFIRHEEERLVLALVDLGNPDGSAQGAAPLVELVVISRAADRVIGERIGVKERIAS